MSFDKSRCWVQSFRCANIFHLVSARPQRTQNKKSIKKQELIRIVSNKYVWLKLVIFACCQPLLMHTLSLSSSKCRMAVSPTEAEASVRLLAETFATELQEKQIQDQLFLKFETSATLPEVHAEITLAEY